MDESGPSPQRSAREAAQSEGGPAKESIPGRESGKPQAEPGLCVLFLLDVSHSVPATLQTSMVEYINRAATLRRQETDQVGVIVFGREATIAIPPTDEDIQLPPNIDGPVDGSVTDLAAAIRLAARSFPPDFQKRMVIITDGNQTRSDALREARSVVAAGVGIDVVPIQYHHRRDVVVECLAAPGEVRRGQPFDLQVVVSHATSDQVAGRLVITQAAGFRSEVVSDERVEMPSGEETFAARHEIQRPGFYQYEARFVPDRLEDDGIPQNNRATAFTYVPGKGEALLIENHEDKSRHDRLVDALRSQGVDLTVRPSDNLFSGLAQLLAFDTVILADVPRDHFTDDQIKMLAANTQQMGAGLVMIGGPNSFGAGGWTGTDVERAMPVDFQIKRVKVVPHSALVMVMQTGQISQGNYRQKVIVEQTIKAIKEAIRVLGPGDYCGVVHWNGMDQWAWKPGMVAVGGNLDKMLARVDSMVPGDMPGDMPEFDPALRMAQQALANLPGTAVKHIIVIGDGRPKAPSASVVRALAQQKVTISTVDVGMHGPAENQTLATLASTTGGKHYKVNNPKALPKIFQREARRAARPLVFESGAGMVPRVEITDHEMIRGIARPFPPVNGYVMSSWKRSQLADVVLATPLPPGEVNSTLLAGRRYGLGRTVAYTSDASTRWNPRWLDWEDCDKFFGQVVHWSMRPAADTRRIAAGLEIDGGQILVRVSALDKSQESLNSLSLTVTAVGPDLQPVTVKIEQTDPGEYVGAFAARDAGNYFVMITPGDGQVPIRAGVNLPESDELGDGMTNRELLETLAALEPEGGAPGTIIEGQTGSLDELITVNPFRNLGSR